MAAFATQERSIMLDAPSAQVDGDPASAIPLKGAAHIAPPPLAYRARAAVPEELRPSVPYKHALVY